MDERKNTYTTVHNIFNIVAWYYSIGMYELEVQIIINNNFGANSQSSQLFSSDLYPTNSSVLDPV